MKYIVTFDIGVASVGWAVIDKENAIVMESGSNIFPEASATDNQTRRGMRQSRRMKRRERTRLNDFDKLWENNTFVIPKARELDIVSLKVKALYENISMDELYMILYNYLKHRGISYLEDATDDSVSGGECICKWSQIKHERNGRKISM
jgi:CRISPR-associated endonuclease Csn1